MAVEVQPGLKIELCACGPDLDFSAPFSLGKDEVRIWYAALEFLSPHVPRLLPLLSDEEKDRASHFHFEQGRNDFILSRGLLRQLSGSCLGVPSRELGFAYSKYGKPFLSTPASAGRLAFNLSHTEGMVILAFTWERKIGVDVEKVRRDFNIEEISERFFSLTERLYLRSLHSEQQYEAFFRCWTRKEAYIKARGEGLSHPLHQFDVSLAPNEAAALLATRPDPAEASRWFLQDLPIGAGYDAAVAVSADDSPAAQLT